MSFIELIENGEFIPFSKYSDGDINYLWDDWEKCYELVISEPNVHIYTVIYEEDSMWVLEGKLLINRVGYLFSRKHVEIHGDIEY